jgi:gamma-carbonic anhydrase
MPKIMPQSAIIPYKGVHPRLEPDVFVATGAVIIGQVTVGAHASIWFNTVLRGDVQSITIGEYTNIQDNTTVHVTAPHEKTTIGHHVTVGHNAVIHACTIGDYVLIGMGATILDGAVIESRCFIAAGSVVTPGKVMPTGMMCMGSPAKPVRTLTEKELQFLEKSATDYAETAKSYFS